MNLNRKKVSGATVALLLTGSLAWQDLSQYKTNAFNTASVEHEVVLVEDFVPVAPLIYAQL